MITSPINPMRYWKLEEIQRMLNKIEGYENVVIEFQCQQADGWNKLNWDCKYGIKEQLVDGQWNWLLKHTFVIEAKTEIDANNLAWQEAAERLVTDVWRTSINSFRNEQKQIMDPQQYKLNQALLEKLKNKSNVTDETTNRTDEMKEMNNIIQTNNTTNTTWTDSETTRWIMSTTIVSLFLYAMYALYKYELIIPTIFTFACIWVVAGMIVLVKEAINTLLD